MDYNTVFNSVLQVAFIFLIAPLLVGVMRKVKARFQSRIGAPIYQPYLDILKLFMKDMVVSSTTSWVFIAAPIAFFGSVAIAAMVLPILFPNNLIAADLVLFIYLFAIGRFMSALAALDTGSAFGGIGASREMLYSILLEPLLFAAIVFFAAFTLNGNVSMSSVVSTTAANWPGILVSPAFWLAGIALFIAILAETGRLPFDNPATHLELTMVHEAMILDYSGPLLALIEWANAAKTVVFFGLFAILFLPFGLPILSSNPLLSAGVFIITVLLLGVLTASLESLTPKWRLFEIPKLLTFSLLLSLIAFLSKIFNNVPTGGFEAVLPFIMLATSLYFLFSATFKRRLEIYIVQSVALALLFGSIALTVGDTSTYWRLGSTILFKVIILPLLLVRAFSTLQKDSKNILNVDPIFLGSPLSVSKSLILSGFLIALSYSITAVLGVHNPLLPVAFSIILIGGLIIATKTHVLLQAMGFLILENGLVLLPTALSLQIPFFGEIATLFDILTLVVVALVLAFKVNDAIGGLDSRNLDHLLEEQ
ncbi:MAG: NADH-quinone oxidoreductase subunit H [Candidatus Micrarchaeota archaeon]|nr:NADH-quinone oxidoreductase subunit H [Candidatus Micrarchaeota archaeon]